MALRYDQSGDPHNLQEGAVPLSKRGNQQIRQRMHSARPNENVWDRMNRRVQEYQHNKSILLNPYENNLISQIDQETGQPLFHPQVISKRRKPMY